MVEKKKKKKTKTIRIWRNFQQKLQEMKKKGECISTIVERCLTTKVNLNDILEKEGIEIELGPLDGMKITVNPGDPIPKHILEHTRRVMKK